MTLDDLDGCPRCSDPFDDDAVHVTRFHTAQHFVDLWETYGEGEGFTQAQFADLLGVKRKTLYNAIYLVRADRRFAA